ncbi:acetyl/propionyl/methylcrotonyl-CoA carboxylase subunit alpha [Rhodanobacter sp. DHG33]|uniref:acetyl/propionyl/methylcrotonyl-CoA carboxylase subunit alpha n=1 Tax=Rhodanobacter sp. DHG33 TaxID=2775921 RepID=UPI0017815AD4|nr:acetyl/propionyl/methylcrotonyl-CoA carboxylase subunit alpha [Rhodanobacter sp. DHG33]MBD8899950.1 acetyl/propionyl/methylcrotonyl-CoA carboxylase subunit alpha [Rhodanobacter sp. DHG33]
MFERVLIANRGEIACRVIRTCRRLGIRSIAVYSEADRDAQHVRLADEAWPIGGPRPAESYLRIDTILDAAKKSGAQAIHPGYGFLSENTAFSRACADAGIVFIGPDPESIEAMGSKSAAKVLMAKHAVPLVPGYNGDNQDNAFLAEQAHAIGYPLIIKPSAGGGGKGMQIVRSDAAFPEALATAQRVAQAAFGDASMLLERYVEHPRHIEFQVFGDRHGHVIHLDERECSAQRRYQKVLEETPSPFLTPETRAAMGAAAVAAAKAVNYVGAGTVEFIVGPQGDFHFMEMNTRLQVEHPVTELTHGIDLVEWQLRIAHGEALPLTQEQVASHGHAIEVRLYAEDPEQNFLPGSGKLHTLRLPEPSHHVRIDGGVAQGDTVTIFYDPMIAKLIVWDVDRPQALQRLREALAECEIEGPKSNIAFLERLARHPAITEASIDTGYLDRHLDEFVTGHGEPDARTLFAAATAALLHDEAHVAADRADPHSPWASADAWRVGHAGKRVVALARGEARYEIEAHGHAGDYRLRHGDDACEVHGARFDGDALGARFGNEAERHALRSNAHRVLLHDADGRRWRLDRAAAYAWASKDSAGGNQVVAPMPGRIVLVKAKPGDSVEEGQELLVMEAMKMELALKAPRAGTIESMNATQGDFVEADSVLVRFVS